MLFVLAVDLLQSIIYEALRRGLLCLSMALDHDPDFPIIQYANNTLLFMQASTSQLHCLKAILNTFEQSSGLRVSFHKSCLIPINVREEKFHLLTGVIGCKVGSLPFTNLGLPLGTTKPKVQDIDPLIDRVERQISASSAFISYGGSLTMINLVLTHLPT